MTNELIQRLAAEPVVVAARARDEKAFFGQGWSHYERDFRVAAGGCRFSLSVWNTPNHLQVNWSVQVPGKGLCDPVPAVEQEWLSFALTPEETRALAGQIGLSVGAWLEEAAASCSDYGQTRAANVIEPAAFHAGRADD